MTKDEQQAIDTIDKIRHKKRHLLLHNNLDELFADWISQERSANTKSPIIDLIRWSHEQCKEPTGPR